MVNYKDLGLVNTREMFKKAIKGGYAIPAFNFNNMEQLQAIIAAAVETKSPVILQVSKGARNYANPTLLRYMAQGAVEYAKELGCPNPQIVLHLDHGDSFELCKSCVDMGFSSVMIDGSHLPYEENVALTKKVVDYAHQYDVTVEGELGVLAGIEDEVSAEHHTYTDPEEVVDFIAQNVKDNVRELEGVFVSLMAYATTLNQPFTIDLARNVLSNSVKISKRQITFEGIVEKVCSQYSISSEMLYSKSRKRDVADSRQLIMALAKKHTKMSSTTIGMKLKRNHATVLHACKTIDERMSVDKDFKNMVESIEQSLM